MIFKPCSALLSAVKATAETFSASLASWITGIESTISELQTQVETRDTEIANLKTGLADLEARFEALPTVQTEAQTETVTMAQVTEAARVESAKAVAEAVQATGSNAIQPAPIESAQTAGAETEPQTADEWKAAWAKSDKLQAEFPDAESCAAYHEGIKSGSISA